MPFENAVELSSNQQKNNGFLLSANIWNLIPETFNRGLTIKFRNMTDAG